MADVMINIRMSNGSTVNVSGVVADTILAPFTSQLSALLSTAVSATA